MSLMLLIPILAFITVALMAVALAAPKETTAHSRLRAYGYDLASRPIGDLSQPFTRRVILPFFGRIGAMVRRMTPVGVVAQSQERLRQARQPMSLTTFLVVRAAFAFGLPALILLGPVLNGNVSMLNWGIGIILLYFGYRLPDIWLSFKIDSRREKITRALPDALDLIVVCVEAGNGLEAAIAKVVETGSGPLAEEFEQTLTEISLGRSRRDAMHDMSERCASPDLQTFIAAILQADQMGVSIAETLRIQADAMRIRRRQRAEELIAKAPVKMLLPMTGFIFPALMIVLLGPAMIRVFEVFSEFKK